jgi:hypothetical protein
MEDAIIQLGNIKQKHTQIFEKLKTIQQKINIMLSKQGGKNREIQQLIRSIEKIIKESGLSDETFEPINKLFEDAKKIEDDEDKISSLKEVEKTYIDLIDTINNKKIVKIKSEIDSIINSIQKSVDKYTAEDKAEIEKEFEGFNDKYHDSNLKLNDLIKLKNDLEEMNISRFGKIKVYMKIKPTKSGDNIISKDGSYIINDFFQINNDQTIEILPDNKFGPFSKVSFTTEKIGKDSEYKNITKNKNLFDEMCSENSPLNINSLLGRSTILFGYGISGSGKSWTILGGKDDEGLIPLLIKSLTTNGITVKPFKIFEHHLNSDDFITTDGSAPYFVEGKLKSEIRDFDLNTYAKDNSPIDFIKLEKARIALRSIKKTPNNPTSSRTHLFIVYEITKEGSEKGYVTFIDSAGKEEPLEIAKQFYTGDIKDPSLPFGPKTENDYKHASFTRFNFGEIIDDNEKQKKYQKSLNLVKDIMREGFFINESLAHMIYYFTGGNISDKLIFEKKTEGKKSVVSEYKSYNKEGKLNVFYKPPSPSSRIIKKIETLVESNDKDPIMITTIFDYLTNLCTVKDQKKFKFVMLGNTRTEAKYRDDIIKTLRLVDLLKST